MKIERDQQRTQDREEGKLGHVKLPRIETSAQAIVHGQGDRHQWPVHSVDRQAGSGARAGEEA